MKKLLLSISILIFLTTINAQSIGGGFMVGSPRGEYKDFNPQTGYGLQIQGMLINPSEYSPFGLGIDIGFLIYSSDTEHRPFSYTIPDIGVDVTRTNSMANMHLVFQVAPFQGRLQPYAEFYGGGSYLFTMTSIESDYYDEHIASDVNYDDFAWSYGIGGGFKVLLVDSDFDEPEIFLDFKFRYLRGSRAKYLTDNDILINDRTHTVTYFPRESETDQMTFTIGVEARF